MWLNLNIKANLKQLKRKNKYFIDIYWGNSQSQVKLSCIKILNVARDYQLILLSLKNLEPSKNLITL